MNAQELIDTARNTDGYVRVTFPKTLVGIRCLKSLVAVGKGVGMMPSAADRREIENILLLVEWSTQTSFNFMDLGKLDDDMLHQLARDIVSVG